MDQDQNPCFSDLKDAKKFSLSFYPQAHYLHAKILCQNFILKALFQSAQHLYEKLKDPAPDLDTYHWLMDPDPGGPKTCVSGSPTLVRLYLEGPIRCSRYFMSGMVPPPNTIVVKSTTTRVVVTRTLTVLYCSQHKSTNSIDTQSTECQHWIGTSKASAKGCQNWFSASP